MIGMGLAMILEKRGANRPEVINRYIELQTGTFMQDLKCFKGVPEMLVALRNSGYLIGTATMRRGAVSRVVLGGMGILEHFDAIVGADDTPEPKPSGIHILTTCQAMNVLPGSAVMVGDTKYDIMAARAAGVMAVGVTWGLGKREEMAEAGAKHIFDNVGELEKFLKCVR
jgi:HAD superfamily hydrolase (TIGR01549 family)